MHHVVQLPLGWGPESQLVMKVAWLVPSQELEPPLLRAALVFLCRPQSAPRKSLFITLRFLHKKETKEVIDKSQGERKVVKERGDEFLSGPPTVFPECLSEDQRWPPLFRPPQHTLGFAIAPRNY